MNEQQNKTFRERAIAYAESYLEAFTNTISTFYGEDANEIIEEGYPWMHLGLYKKELGKDLSISVFCSNIDFFVFFTKPTGEKIRDFINMYGNAEYGDEWTFHTPQPVKTEQVKDLLKLNDSITIGEEVNVPGTPFITNDLGEMRKQAQGHGRNRGQRYGELAKQYIPQLREFVSSTNAKLSIRKRYEILKNNSSQPKEVQFSPQKVGHEFESLIRDLLNMYGWQARKITLSGEGNDFTAIFEGHHILGETRWEKDPIKGEEVHAFAGKLTPRPQTIGLMISYSGFDTGAYDVVKRHISNRTIVFFEKEHIDKIIISLTDPGEIFSVELRNVYDYLFENVKKKDNDKK